MQVRDVLASKGNRVITIEAGAAVSDAISRLVQNNIGSLPVTEDDGRLVGVISERDVLRGLHERGPAFREARVADVMTRDPVSCAMDHDVEDVMCKMSEHRIAKVPVLCEGRLCGIVSVGDVVKVLYAKVCTENHHLMSYIHGNY